MKTLENVRECRFGCGYVYNDPDAYKDHVGAAPRREVCRYCHSHSCRSSAWTANGTDLERFERIHRVMKGGPYET